MTIEAIDALRNESRELRDEFYRLRDASTRRFVYEIEVHAAYLRWKRAQTTAETAVLEHISHLDS